MGVQLIKEYKEPLDKDEAWEAVTSVKEDPKNVAVTGRDIKEEMKKYEWEETPSLWRALLDPKKIPCLRETGMAGIIGGAFGMGMSTFARGKWDRAVRHYVLGFLSVSVVHWTLCNFINYRRHLLISKTIHSHPQIKPESELIRTVDERVQNQSKSQQTK